MPRSEHVFGMLSPLKGRHALRAAATAVVAAAAAVVAMQAVVSAVLAVRDGKVRSQPLARTNKTPCSMPVMGLLAMAGVSP